MLGNVLVYNVMQNGHMLIGRVCHGLSPCYPCVEDSVVAGWGVDHSDCFILKNLIWLDFNTCTFDCLVFFMFCFLKHD